ncbi:MAG: ComEC/Rec2 family competence protein [Candidatus Magasanikbacteria bacterium]
MRKVKIFLTILLLIFTAWVLILNTDEIKRWYKYNVSDKKYLKVVFLDIGQGDSTFFEFSNGEQMVVDCSKDRRVLHGLGEVMWFYDRTIDYLMITHPDLDHYGGCIDLLKRFEVENIIYNGVKKDSKFWEVFWNQYKQEDANYIIIDEPRKIQIASSTIQFLYPDHRLGESSHSSTTVGVENTNNTSIVFTLKKGDNELLMTADAEKELEQYLSEKYNEELRANIYKMGHHGSDSSSNEFFIEKVKPEVSIASAGKNNDFGHPAYIVVKRLRELGSKIWRTDQDGDVMIRVFEDSYEVVDEK